MKLPRDLSGEDLVKALVRFEYVVDRQTGIEPLSGLKTLRFRHTF